MADGSQLPLLPGARYSARRWTDADVLALRNSYPVGGISAAKAALPHRTESALFMKALSLKLRSPRLLTDQPRQSWPHLPELDAEIRRAAATGATRGVWLDIAIRWKRPQWYVSRRAGDLGLALPRTTVGTWTPDELELLEATAHCSAAAAARRFRKNGFQRTTSAIQTKRWQNNLRRSDSGVHSSRSLADLLGCSPKVTATAVHTGQLRAQRNDPKRDDSMLLIRERDVRAWLLANPYAIDLHRVPPPNQAWLISVLAGQYAHD